MNSKDIISKGAMRRLVVDLATYLLDLPIEPDSLEVLATERQRVENRSADLVVKLRDHQGETFLLHIEIQNNNDKTMPIRMMRYMSDILLDHPGLPLRQYLIYIGRESLTMADGLDAPGLRYRYGLLDMRKMDCRHLLDKDNPDALILAILCNFHDRDPQSVVNHIYARLRSLLADDDKRFREYVDMLHILSLNRDLDQQIKEAEKMLTKIDIERIPSYQLGMERGMEKGMERGMERGQAALLMRQLGCKFGPLSPTLTQRIGDAHTEELTLWGERVLNAKTLDDIFREE
uniref:Predicted transposase YdaD n=1 Tax=Candidatus Kentrum sp. TC TaxID=2126339 RepID=A0A451ABV9_9GAMM|nr:MAG: Predicted transposase YdaD [Candidatus Kentron sp. TC]VFK49030.1 MAG: Predicted transposase YdaD [Candidatus Kentron sp. TC]VFK63526.1 MAG: Predicted transposase YdaD [Candidatus Kentron sp. TC]